MKIKIFLSNKNISKIHGTSAFRFSVKKIFQFPEVGSRYIGTFYIKPVKKNMSSNYCFNK